MFDLKKMAVRWETNIKNGVCEILCVTQSYMYVEQGDLNFTATKF